MKRRTYAEKLKDPKWQRRRLEVLEADGWTCWHCKSIEKMLHVHHVYYLRNTDPWDYPDDALITLCEDCHSARPVAERILAEATARIDSMTLESLAEALRSFSREEIDAIIWASCVGGQLDEIVKKSEKEWEDIQKWRAERETVGG